MEYDFKIQAEKQKQLDSYIKENASCLTEHDYWIKRVIALNVELNEVSNEIRFFKFWSKKPSSKKEIILDELVDCLHFAFSLGNSLGNKQWKFIIEESKKEIEDIYFELSNKILKISNNKDVNLLQSIMFNFMEIANYMGYSMQDLESAYEIKNKVNYDRQNVGY